MQATLYGCVTSDILIKEMALNGILKKIEDERHAISQKIPKSIGAQTVMRCSMKKLKYMSIYEANIISFIRKI